MTRSRARRTTALLAFLTASALLLTSCAESERNSGDEGGDGGGDASGTFVFAGSAEPELLDPAFAADGETFRVARQIFEGLVGTEPGTADPAPLLAESWDSSDDGLTYTFELREGVTFHDGTDFDAEAVCYNFDRWYNFPEGVQTDDFAYYYAKLFRGFATGKTGGIYEGCTAEDASTAVIELNSPFAGFISALSLPALSMQSPTALEEYQDDGASNVNTTPYSTEQPTGTGPFRFVEWDRGNAITLERYDDYWGEKAQVETARVVAIADPQARASAVRNGDVDGADLIGPADIAPLEEDGFQVLPLSRSRCSISASTNRGRRWTTSASVRRSRTPSTRRLWRAPRCPRAPRSPPSSCRPRSTAGPRTSRPTSTTPSAPGTCSRRPARTVPRSSSTTRPT